MYSDLGLAAIAIFKAQDYILIIIALKIFLQGFHNFLKIIFRENMQILICVQLCSRVVGFSIFQQRLWRERQAFRKLIWVPYTLKVVG